MIERLAPTQQRGPFVLIVLTILLGSLGQVLLNRPEAVGAGALLLLAASALAALAFWRLPSTVMKPLPGPSTPWSWKDMVALLVASIPAWVGGWLLAIRWDSLFTGLMLYAGGLALVCLVCARREGWAFPSLSTVREHGVELTLVGLVLALGLFLLVFRLDYYPPPGGISWNDEAQIGKDAYGVLYHDSRPWQFPISVYTTCLAFLALGPTVLALRLNFVLLGFLTLVVFYLLTREIFRFPVALASTFLFAVSRWHIAFSRLALPSTPAMLLEVCAFYLLLRGRRTGGMMSYVLAGMTLGLGLYSHASFRVVPVLVLLLFASEARSWWRATRATVDEVVRTSHPLVAPWLGFLASLVVFTLPLAAFIRREPHVAFGERFSSVMPVLFGSGEISHTEGVAERARRLLGFFNYKGEPWGAVNIPDAPMLDAWTGVLFVLGLGCCLIYFWRRRHLFYVGWFLITLIGGGLLTIDLRSHRFVGLMPVLFIFAGVFLDGALATFEAAFGSKRRRYFGLLLVPILLLAGCANYQTFFQRQIYADSVRIEFTREIAAVANHIASLGEGRYFYLFANFPYYTSGMDFAWMAREAPGERGIDVLDVVPSHRQTGDQDVVYVFSTPYDVEALVDVVQYFYPQAEVSLFEGEYDRYTFASVQVGADEVRGAQGLRASYYRGQEAEAEPDLERIDAQISFDWRVDSPPVAVPFVAEWRGTVFAPHAGTYVFQIAGSEGARILVDGQSLGGGDTVELFKGWHELEVQHVVVEEGGQVELLWTVEESEPEAMASHYLNPRTDVHGVLVTVFEGASFEGTPVERSVEPSLSLLRMPTAWQSAFVAELEGELYSLDCRGALRVEEPGSYRFEVVPWNGQAGLYVDGVLVSTALAQPSPSTGAEVVLEPGWHDLRLRYSYEGGEFSGVQVFWTPPGGEKEAIPPASLRPVEEVTAGIVSHVPLVVE
jgi:4-amino-4-deoxy-L-arabinose transferase-like glycosyltransferase